MIMFLSLSAILVGLMYISVAGMEEEGKASDAKRGNLQKKKKRRIPLSVYIKWYKRFKTFILFRKDFHQIELRISELSTYTPQEVRIVSTQIYGLSLIGSLAIVFVGCIAYRDIIITFLILLYAQVIKSSIIYSQMDKIQFQVLLDLKMAMSSVREKYQTRENIPDAVRDAEVSKLLKASFDDIYMILTSTNAEKRLEEMYATNPFRLVQTFTGVCYVLNETGDTKTENGESNFLTSVSKLNEEVKIEILKGTQIHSEFKGLKALPIIPVLGMSILETVISSSVPGITAFYKGTVGYLSRIIIILSSILCYQLICKMNSVSPVARNDRWPFIISILKKKWFRNFVDSIKPKHGMRKRAKNKELKKAISAKKMEHLYAEKVLCAVLVFVFSLVCSIATVVIGKQHVYNSYTYKSFTTDEKIDNKELAKRKGLDAKFLARETCPSDEDIDAMLQKEYPKLDEYARSDQVQRLKNKYNNYHNTIYYWWILAIVFILGYVGWLTPDFILFKRAKAVKEESEEDTLQLQTMISILMNTPIDTLDILYWLQRQSQIHKDALAVCCQNYPSDPIKAIDALRRSDPTNATFVRMCNKLALTVYQIPIKDAFADIEADRSYELRLREMHAREVITQRREIAGICAILPLTLVMFLELLLPMGTLGWSEYTNAMKEQSTISSKMK